MAQSQFTLRRLLINVTVFCAMLAFTSAFPQAANVVALNLMFWTPALSVMAIACYFSKRRVRTLALVAAGALFGWLLAPRVTGLPTMFWDRFFVEFVTLGLPLTGSVLIFALADRLIAALGEDATR